jgi:hypothetical protein
LSFLERFLNKLKYLFALKRETITMETTTKIKGFIAFIDARRV